MRADLRATRAECERGLPGDQLVPDPDRVIMNGISIEAPPAKVWPWLAQMGSGRAGWYAYDFVDNDGHPSATTIVVDLQGIRVGDVLPSLPGATDSFVVASVQPGQDLVLAVPAANGKTAVSWEFFLEPQHANRSRLLVRGRVSKDYPTGPQTRPAPKPERPIEYAYKLLASIPRRFMCPIGLLGHDAMQARQLRGIKRRAETDPGGVQRATAATGSRLDPERIWRELIRASFAVISYSTASGEPRSSGVVFKTVGRRLYVAVACDSWKARHIATGAPVAVTVPVRRGGLLTLVFPIPPATVSFRSTAIVHPAGSVDIGSVSRQLESLLPQDRRDRAVVIELVPEGRFLTYGIGVPLSEMREPELARAVVPITGSSAPPGG